MRQEQTSELRTRAGETVSIGGSDFATGDDVRRWEARTVKPRVSRPRIHVSVDPHLEWLLLSANAALGERGTLASTVSQVEAGSVGGMKLDRSGSFIHPLTDQQLGLYGHGGDVERWRWLWSAWCAVSEQSRNVLAAYFSKPRAEFRSDEGLTEKYVEGNESPGVAGQTRTGVESSLGEWVGLAFALAKDPAKLLLACREPSPIRKGKPLIEETKRRRRLVGSSIRAARDAFREAHKEWLKCKREADPMRLDWDRADPQKEHKPTEDGE